MEVEVVPGSLARSVLALTGLLAPMAIVLIAYLLRG